MKPFTLKEYLDNPTRKVMTRNGYTVTIICTNAKVFSPGNDSTAYPIVALVSVGPRRGNPHISNEEVVFSYSTDGRVNTGANGPMDLCFETVKVSGWVNIYKAGSADAITSTIIYKTKEEALRCKHASADYLDTIFVEWEE